MWRAVTRDEEAVRRLAVDPHSPPDLRCNAVVTNLDAFHEAFGVAGDGRAVHPAGAAGAHLVSEQGFAGHLAGLDPGALTALLEHRPDTLVEPAPRSFAELAQRLGAVDSLAAALERVDADEVAVIRAIALGAGTVAELAARCHAPVDQVRGVVDGLGERGLAWRADDRVGLPKRLAADFAADVHTFLPLAALANRIRVDDVRTAVEGLGGATAGLRKAELVDRLAALYADTALVARVIAALPTAAREHLEHAGDPARPLGRRMGRVRPALHRSDRGARARRAAPARRVRAACGAAGGRPGAGRAATACAAGRSSRRRRTRRTTAGPGRRRRSWR